MLPPPWLPLDNYSVTVKRSMSGRLQSRADVYGLRAARDPNRSGRSKPGRLSL